MREAELWAVQAESVCELFDCVRPLGDQGDAPKGRPAPAVGAMLSRKAT